jgi:radical SAM/Cys-rich protein
MKLRIREGNGETMNRFDEQVIAAGGGPLRSQGIDLIQANITLRCNQGCAHCHLEAGPERREMMDWGVMERIVEVAEELGSPFVDITGGAPELHPELRPFVSALREVGCPVQVRTNLTVLGLPGLVDLPQFFASREVQLVASLPCYLEENVRAQRGPGAYEKSVSVIHRLNAAGYAVKPELALDLVYNPGGAFLPPEQEALEADYRRELGARHGIRFSHLRTITNMPLGRFQEILRRAGREEEYMGVLEGGFNRETLDGLMCRRQISVGWDGTLYDCDFNLALGLPLEAGAPRNIAEFDAKAVAERRIVTGEHCFGCTAGAGSSCAGALVSAG